MVKYKVTQAHDGKWYVWEKFSIHGGNDYRWVISSRACGSRSEAFGELPAGGNTEDTVILNN
jgi:hypothetical protein